MKLYVFLLYFISLYLRSILEYSCYSSILIKPGERIMKLDIHCVTLNILMCEKTYLDIELIIGMNKSLKIVIVELSFIL